jgi:hypothetical protein
MSLDVNTFQFILSNGFSAEWNSTLIPRKDVPSTAMPCIDRRLLDAEGALGLILHHLSSTMQEILLQQIFGLVPTMVLRYLDFASVILLRTLHSIASAWISWLCRDQFAEYSGYI